MNAGWSWFIIVLTVGSLAWCWWMLRAYSKKRPVETEGPEPDTTGHTWDGDLREYNNPLPLWWLMLFYGTIIFGAVYLVLYPGLGNFGGTMGWTQQKQHAEEVRMADARFAEVFARYEGMDLPTMAADPDARLTGQRIYLNFCIGCHGSDARGAPGYPNLTDDDWLYGGHPDAILTSILNGRAGVMPALGAGLGEQGVNEVANYVYTLNGRTAPDPQAAAAGQAKYTALCGACHGPGGQGMQALGAPNLTDDVWLYGGSVEEIAYGINNGRANRMPAHKDLLGEDKVRLVAAYIYGLSGEPDAE